MSWNRLSLRAKVTTVAAVAAAAVLTAGALLLYVGLNGTLNAAVTEELRIRADDLTAEAVADAPLVLGGGFPAQIVAADGTVLAPEDEDPLLTPDELERALQGEVVLDRPVDAVGEDARLLARPLEVGADDGDVVVVAGSTGPVVGARRRLAAVLGIAGPTMILVVAATAWLVSGAALRPVRRMSRRAASLSLQSPDERLPQPPGNDEIAELGQTLNRMLERIATTIAHERTFIDNASHELRSPVAVLRGELELARLELDEEDDIETVRPAIDSALEETDRLSRLTDHLLVLARADARSLADHREPVDLGDLVAGVVDRYRDREVDVGVEAEPAVVFGDAVSLEQAVSNLVDNACRWARSRVRVVVGTTDQRAEVLVADDGPGFAAELGKDALDRFTRADQSRNRHSGGAGLGLSIVDAVARVHDGEVVLGNGAPLGGATVRVLLPAHAE